MIDVSETRKEVLQVVVRGHEVFAEVVNRIGLEGGGKEKLIDSLF